MMTQRIAYNILKALGGKATIRQIEKVVEKEHPSIHKNNQIHGLMRKLKAWSYVSWDEDTQTYEILVPYAETTIVTGSIEP